MVSNSSPSVSSCIALAYVPAGRGWSFLRCCIRGMLLDNVGHLWVVTDPKPIFPTAGSSSVSDNGYDNPAWLPGNRC